MKSFVLILMLLLGIGYIAPAQAEFKLPNYATSGNVETEIQSKGKKITNAISIAVGVIAIIGMFVGLGFIGAGNIETGKRYLLGGIIAIVLASMVYVIANLVK